MIIAVTGHRPDKLGGYTEVAQDRVYRLARDTLKLLHPDEVITGMAIGWDQAIAQACIDLHIPYHAYVPFDGQEDTWPQMSRVKYWELRHKAATVKVLCAPGFARWKMTARNKAMVNAADSVLALWSGDFNSGTANCVFYAQRQKKRVKNVWSEFQMMLGNRPGQREMQL